MRQDTETSYDLGDRMIRAGGNSLDQGMGLCVHYQVPRVFRRTQRPNACGR